MEGLQMDEQSERTALLSALTTEHFVLQTANNSTYSEASARSTLYVMVLSSSLVAIGFVAGSTDLLIPFSAEHGRWPEVEPPALLLGPAFAFFGTTASMIAVINNVVAGVGIALLAH